jgi:tetratricopeptide (TPR) repeat protein
LGPGESSSAAPDATRDPEDSPNVPPSRGAKSPSKSAGQPPADSAGKDAPDYAPLHAEESMEIGTFYMRKGDLSAAADRFKYAIELQPHLAKPYILLAKIAEKKNDKAAAVRYYQGYLAILPNAPDAAKVRSRISELKK